ncbi:MAG: hypothetical protein IJQ79_01175, partial [Bacteroidales bacterium]|nr:hypothetical protein [Bacteroidales bacterium]
GAAPATTPYRSSCQRPAGTCILSLRFAHPSHCASLVGPSRSRGHGRPRFPVSSLPAADQNYGTGS